MALFNNLSLALAVIFPVLAQAINHKKNTVDEQTHDLCEAVGNCQHDSWAVSGWAIALWCCLGAFVVVGIMWGAVAFCRPRAAGVVDIDDQNQISATQTAGAKPDYLRRRSTTSLSSQSLPMWRVPRQQHWARHPLLREHWLGRDPRGPTINHYGGACSLQCCRYVDKSRKDGRGRFISFVVVGTGMDADVSFLLHTPQIAIINGCLCIWFTSESSNYMIQWLFIINR